MKSSLASLCVALVASLAFIGLVLLFRPMTAMDRQLLLWYQTPVGFAFVLFTLDRWRTRLVRLPLDWISDAVVLLVSISRTITWFLPLSGHTLFLTYAIFTGQSKLIRGVALVVLTEAVVIKHFWLNDDSTPWVGMIVGLLASIGVLYRQRNCQ